jgi:pantoate kinase
MCDTDFSRQGCVEIPHHITSIWIPYVKPDYSRSGSKGLGLIVSPKLKVCLFEHEVQPPYDPIGSLTFLKKYARINPTQRIGIKTVLPPGYGYAVSAATFIGYFLISGFVSGTRSYLDSLEAAHIAEISEKTGLGDVLAISYGKGIAFRVKEGSPANGKVEGFSFPKSVGILSIYKEKMHTNKLLSMYTYSTRRLALKLLRMFDQNPDFEKFLEVSEEFTYKARMHSFTLDELSFIKSIPGVLGVYAKKSVAVVFVENDKFRDAVDKVTEKFSGAKILRLEPEYNGIIFTDG